MTELEPLGLAVGKHEINSNRILIRRKGQMDLTNQERQRGGIVVAK